MFFILQMENLNEKIIEIVHVNSCIYDKRDAHYKDVKHKEKIWESIGKELNLSVKECKVKWKSLRDRYRREKSCNELPSGSSQKVGTPWKYLSSLDFLAESMEPASTISNICEELDDSVKWLIDDSQPTPPQIQGKKNDDLFTDVLMAMKKKYEEPQTVNVPKYSHFFGMLKEKFDRLSEGDVDELQLEILQLVNRKMPKKKKIFVFICIFNFSLSFFF